MSIQVRVKRVRPDPKPALNSKQLQSIIREEQLKEAEAVKKDFETTTKTWAKQPVFVIQPTAQGVNVYTDDEIYAYVDQGTRPHIIRPKRAKLLRFNATGFQPKTRPGRFKAISGRAAGPPPVFTSIVHHPGTEARQLSLFVRKRHEKRFARKLQQRLKAQFRI